jgi:hypothetical protein
MVKSNKPISLSSRIVLESSETKKKIIKIQEKTGESIKEIIVRLVQEEYSNLGGK